MITTADLKAQTRRELADLARDHGVNGWHGMRKEELIRELRKVQRRTHQATTPAAVPSAEKARPKRSTAAASVNAVEAGLKPVPAKPSSSASRSTVSRQVTTNRSSAGRSVKNTSAPVKATATPARGKPTSKSAAKATAPAAVKTPEVATQRVSPKTARIREQIRARRESLQRNKDLSTATLVGGSAVRNGAQRTRTEGPHRDRVVLLVRDSYWLQANWEITRASVQRAQSAMAERWHTAVPILRLFSVGDVTGNRAESHVRDIPIHGGVSTWYIDVDEPPARFRVAVGYVDDSGRFHTLCRSNLVETPRPGECDRLDEHWQDIAEDYERIYSLSGGYEAGNGDLKEMFEERLHRAMPERGEQGQTIADPTLLRESKLAFEVDAELIVFGTTSPNASVNVAGRPVKLQPDGSFTVRMELPDKRQVLPVTAESRDGLRQRTTVIAVERNTKVMEAVEMDERF